MGSVRLQLQKSYRPLDQDSCNCAGNKARIVGFKAGTEQRPIAVIEIRQHTSVMVITERTSILVQNDLMEHKGIHYAIRIGIAREQWRVAIYPLGNGLPKEKTVFGTHEDAEATARSMINSWLKQQRSAPKKAKQ